MTRSLPDDDDVPSMMALSPQRRKFARRYAETGNATLAAIEAGYGNGNKDHASQTASRLLRVPEVQTAIRDLNAASLGAIAGLAIATLQSIMDDPTMPPAARVKASAEVLDRSGYFKTVQTNVQVEPKLDDADRLRMLRDMSERFGVQLLPPNRVIDVEAVEMKPAFDYDPETEPI